MFDDGGGGKKGRGELSGGRKGKVKKLKWH